MKDIPIIFSAPMILALLEGRKTMTRRLAWKLRHEVANKGAGKVRSFDQPTPWQRVEVGDRLWVRENFFAFGRWIGGKKGAKVTYSFARCARPGPDGNLIFAADFDNGHPLPLGVFGSYDPAWHLRPNIFLPREESRLTLVVTGKKIERLQDISEDDAKAEGVERAVAGQDESGKVRTYRTGFVRIWRDLHGPESWLNNPEVVGLSFTVHKQNIDAMKEAA